MRRNSFIKIEYTNSTRHIYGGVDGLIGGISVNRIASPVEDYVSCEFDEKRSLRISVMCDNLQSGIKFDTKGDQKNIKKY